jgi:hypothetical protein
MGLKFGFCKNIAVSALGLTLSGFAGAGAEPLAFPEALGFGANVTGGRGGTVYHVTNLNDDGVGSFRDAVSQGNRIVVFDVGGIINIKTAVSIKSNITIAGQTAPGEGIAIHGGKLSTGKQSNIIIRYLRIRPGENTASTKDDGLNLYLYRHLSPFEKPIADSLIARVDSSDIKQESKDLYRTLLYSEILLGYKTLRSYSSDSVRYMYYIKDTTCAEDFLIAAQNYVENYPSSKHSSYLKNQIIPFVQKIMNKHRLYRKDPFAHKYYTGGSNLYVYKWLGTLSGEGTDYLNSKMGTSFMIELSLRSWRISLSGYYSYGLITYLKPEFKGTSDGDSEEDVTYGLNLGFTAFDSRYIRVEPFLGYSRTNFESAVNAESSDEFALGTNVDYRFWSTTPRNAFSYLTFSCLLRFKYMVQFGSFKQEGVGNNKKFGTVRHTFALGLGIGDW